MTYEPQIWEDEPSTDTPISAERLSRMEDGIASAHSGQEKVDVITGNWNDFPLGWCIGLPEEDNAASNTFAVVLTQEGAGEAEGFKVQRCTWVDPETTGLSAAQRTFQDSTWGDWALLRPDTGQSDNPKLVDAAYTPAIGETVHCLYGGYRLTIPDGNKHGQTITAITGYGLLTGTLVEVEYFSALSQSTTAIQLPASGAQTTLRWVQDIEFEESLYSGWVATTVVTIDPLVSQ